MSSPLHRLLLAACHAQTLIDLRFCHPLMACSQVNWPVLCLLDRGALNASAYTMPGNG